ncbi:MAG: flippase-like domain-containing protein [Bdellovibrio sp.]|nr:flippase-like domain-containing protein [Bdellovibrio sp.]
MKKKSSLTPHQVKFRNRIKTFLKLALVIALLAFMLRNDLISPKALLQAFHRWPQLLPAMGGLFFTMLLGVFRWQWLLRAQNIHLSWYRTFQLTLIGNFFNIALPGAVSGDFIKAYYIGQETGGQKSRAFGSILFDRVAGLSALVMVSAGALAYQFQKYSHSSLIGAVGLLMTIAAICVALLYGYLFLVKEKHDVFLIFLRKTERKFPAAGAFVRVYESLRHYHNHRLTILKVLAISCVIHLTVGWVCLTFAHVLDPGPIRLADVYVVVPMGLLVTAVPVAPAGIGTGNLAFSELFKNIGSLRGGDIYNLYAMTNILIGMIGALIYFRFRSKLQISAAKAKEMGL